MPEKTDWVTGVAVAGGLAAVGIGAMYLLKKPPTAEPGEKLEVTFKFEYWGPTQNYVFRVTCGYVGWTGIEFYEDESTRQEFTREVEEAVEWQERKVVVNYQIPEIMDPNSTDIEFSIRYSTEKIVPGMRIIAKNVVGQE